MAEVNLCAPCEHIYVYYVQLQTVQPCIAWNLLRRGYREAARGIWSYENNLFDEPEPVEPEDHNEHVWAHERYQDKHQADEHVSDWMWQLYVRQNEERFA